MNAVLADTSVWIDHLRNTNRQMSRLLEQDAVYCHPFIVGELACGNLKNRSRLLDLMQQLAQLPLADHVETLELIDRYHLHGKGIGWVDAHLLASCLIFDTSLWTLDKRLAKVAQVVGCGV